MVVGGPLPTVHVNSKLHVLRNQQTPDIIYRIGNVPQRASCWEDQIHLMLKLNCIHHLLTPRGCFLLLILFVLVAVMLSTRRAFQLTDLRHLDFNDWQTWLMQSSCLVWKHTLPPTWRFAQFNYVFLRIPYVSCRDGSAFSKPSFSTGPNLPAGKIKVSLSTPPQLCRSVWTHKTSRENLSRFK